MKQCILCLQAKLVITLSLGSKVTDRVISEPCYNEVIYYRHIHRKIINLGTMTWLSCIENHIIVRHVIMRSNYIENLCLRKEILISEGRLYTRGTVPAL